jgi:hypothetical protein
VKYCEADRYSVINSSMVTVFWYLSWHRELS